MRASCYFIIHGQTARLAQDHFGTPAEVLSSVTFALQAHIDCEPCTINGKPGFPPLCDRPLEPVQPPSRPAGITVHCE